MIDHAKAAILGAIPAIAGLAAAMLPWLNDLRTLLVVVSLLVAMATGLLGLWFRKLIRDREDEREEADEKREGRLRQQVEEIKKEQATTRELLAKYLVTQESLSKEVQRIADEIKRAHLRLDTGNDKFHDLELKMARYASERRPRRTTDSRDDSSG